MSSRAFVILIPPSEGKAESGLPGSQWDPDGGAFGGTLGPSRRKISNTLRREKGGSAALLGVSGKHLVRAQEANRCLLTSHTLPAWQRYTGVVWDHLDLASLSASQRRSTLSRIVIPSGLFGLVRADDLIPDYRLKMGARLSPFGTMSRWWNEMVTEALRISLGKRLVIDLLPQEHRAVIDWSHIPNAHRVDLVSKKGGVVGGHNAKAAKGLLARHLLLSTSLDIASSVASFTHDEYSAKVTT